MRNLYSIWPPESGEEQKRATYRLLRRLRIALIIWLISFLGTVVWFSYGRLIERLFS